MITITILTVIFIIILHYIYIYSKFAWVTERSKTPSQKNEYKPHHNNHVPKVDLHKNMNAGSGTACKQQQQYIVNLNDKTNSTHLFLNLNVNFV